jgi:WD40 repeat protein
LDPDTGEQVGQPIVSDAIRGISQYAVGSDNRWLAVAAGKEVQIIDASNGQQRGEALRGHDDEVNKVDLSPDGQMVATASDDKTVRLWDFRSGKQIGEPLKGHQYRVQSAQFSNDGRRVFSYSLDLIRIWDTKTRQPIGKPIGGPDGFYLFSAMTVSKDSRRIAASNGNVIQQWDAQTGEPVGPRMEGHDKDINDLSYSPDGRYLVSVSKDRTLRFWDTLSGSQIGEPVDTAVVGDTSYVGFSHDGRRVFISAGRLSLDGTPPFVGGGIWQVPGPAAWTDALCDKLAANPSDAQWKDWVSPDISNTELCLGKPRRQ